MNRRFLVVLVLIGALSLSVFASVHAESIYLPLVGFAGDAPAEETTQTATVLAVGDIAMCSYTQDEATAARIANQPGIVLALGDIAYPNGTAAEFADCYDPAWGRFKARTRPVPGNHEYHTAGASGYFGYFGRAATPREPSCRSGCQGYYSFDVGQWHVIALNSEIEMDAASAQMAWLQQDLATFRRRCTLAYWHLPRWSSDAFHGANTKSAAVWDLLYASGVDVVINGHAHLYERFARQNPEGKADVNGIRQFTVGTGGAALYPWSTILPTSQARNNTVHGVLKLTLRADGYDWQFLPIAGQSYTDRGSSKCVE